MATAFQVLKPVLFPLQQLRSDGFEALGFIILSGGGAIACSVVAATLAPKGKGVKYAGIGALGGWYGMQIIMYLREAADRAKNRAATVNLRTAENTALPKDVRIAAFDKYQQEMKANWPPAVLQQEREEFIATIDMTPEQRTEAIIAKRRAEMSSAPQQPTTSVRGWGY